MKWGSCNITSKLFNKNLKELNFQKENSHNKCWQALATVVLQTGTVSMEMNVANSQKAERHFKIKVHVWL